MVPSTSITFVSQASLDNGIVKSYGLRKRVEAVKNCRKISKSDMKFNDAMPKMKVDPERYVSTILLACLAGSKICIRLLKPMVWFVKQNRRRVCLFRRLSLYIRRQLGRIYIVVDIMTIYSHVMFIIIFRSHI
jgi:hypothetical protein